MPLRETRLCTVQEPWLPDLHSEHQWRQLLLPSARPISTLLASQKEEDSDD